MDDDNKTRIRPATLRSLARQYQINERTLKRWLTPFIDAIGEPHNGSKIYSPCQVRQIYERLGEP